MNHLRLVLAVARVAAVLVMVAMFIKVAPTIASHAVAHSVTYSSPPAAAAARNH